MVDSCFVESVYRTHAVWTGGARSSQWQQDVLCTGLSARWTVRIMLQHMLTLRKRQFYSKENAVDVECHSDGCLVTIVFKNPGLLV